MQIGWIEHRHEDLIADHGSLPCFEFGQATDPPPAGVDTHCSVVTGRVHRNRHAGVQGSGKRVRDQKATGKSSKRPLDPLQVGHATGSQGAGRPHLGQGPEFTPPIIENQEIRHACSMFSQKTQRREAA